MAIEFFKRFDGFLLKHEALVTSLEAERLEKDNHIATLEAEREEQDARVEALEAEKAAQAQELVDTRKKLESAEKTLHRRDATLKQLETAVADADKRLRAVSGQAVEETPPKSPKKRRATPPKRLTNGDNTP